MPSRTSAVLVRLSIVVGVSAAVAAIGALLTPGTWSGGSTMPFTTVGGASVELFGRGLYARDGLLAASTYLGTDVVTLALMVPLLAYTLARSVRGSLHGRLLLAAALGFFAYNGAHLALAVAFNPLFPLYVVLFGCSVWAFGLALADIPTAELAAATRPDAPRQAPAVFLAASGAILGMVWLSDLVPALLAGSAPAALGASTTLVTHAIDLGVIVPATLTAAALLRRGAPLGTLLGAVLLVIQAVVGVVVAGQTAVGLLVGVDLPPQAVAVFVVPFLALAAVAVGLTRRLLGEIDDVPAAGLAGDRVATEAPR